MTKGWFYFSLFLLTFLVYGASLQYGFSQDDWYFLSISQAKNIGDVLNFFNPNAQSGFAFFRPLGTQFYYFLATFLVGFTQAPFYMHLFMITVQAASAILVYKLLISLKYSESLSKIIAVVYATAASVFLSLYYIAATQQLLATFFSLLSLLSFTQKKPYLVALYWALALLSKETAIMTPVIAVILTQLPKPNLTFLRHWRQFLPYFMVGIAYIALRLLAPPTVQSEYHFVFGTNVVSTLRWFFLFAYGSPEEWIRYGLAGGGLNLATIIKDYGSLGLINLISTFILLIFTILAFLKTWRSSRPWLYLCWWFFGLAPILFLQNHRYPHYLDLSLIPLLLLTLESNKRFRYVLACLMIVASVSAIMVSMHSHWTVGRSAISARAIEYFKTNQVCSYSHLIFAAPNPYPAELSYALSLENGPRVLCNNPNLKVEYKENVEDKGSALVIDPRELLQ